MQVHLTQTNLLTIASDDLGDVGSERAISLCILRMCQRVDREVGLAGLQANQWGLVRHTLDFIAVRVPIRWVVLFLPLVAGLNWQYRLLVRIPRVTRLLRQTLVDTVHQHAILQLISAL